MEPKNFDLIVLGAGPAGECGAGTSSFFGKRVAIVERCKEIGGAGINTGTLPSKTLRETALALSGLKARNLYGVDLSLRRDATVADFLYHEERVVKSARSRVMEKITGEGITLFCGQAAFVDSRTVRVGPSPECPDVPETILRGEKFLIATGSSPFRPPEFPFDSPRIHDSDEILRLDRIPRSLAVIGAGVIGCEYASTFAALGSKVTLLDGRDALLPFLDRELAEALAYAMAKLGITFRWKEKVLSCVVPPDGDVGLSLSSGSTLSVEQVLVAAGRSSNTGDLNLMAAGIRPGERGLLEVNAHFQTSAPHIYAAGDVIGFPSLASTGMEQARVAMCHSFDKTFKIGMDPVLPYGIYTIPEAGMVGETEESLQKKGIDYVVGRANYAQNARGEIIGDETGFLKLLYRREDLKLLGVHILGEGATEIVHLGMLALVSGASAELFNRACFNYPTLGELYKQATYSAIVLRERTRRGSEAGGAPLPVAPITSPAAPPPPSRPAR